MAKRIQAVPVKRDSKRYNADRQSLYTELQLSDNLLRRAKAVQYYRENKKG